MYTNEQKSMIESCMLLLYLNRDGKTWPVIFKHSFLIIEFAFSHTHSQLQRTNRYWQPFRKPPRKPFKKRTHTNTLVHTT